MREAPRHVHQSLSNTLLISPHLLAYSSKPMGSGASNVKIKCPHSGSQLKWRGEERRGREIARETESEREINIVLIKVLPQWNYLRGNATERGGVEAQMETASGSRNLLPLQHAWRAIGFIYLMQIDLGLSLTWQRGLRRVSLFEAVSVYDCLRCCREILCDRWMEGCHDIRCLLCDYHGRKNSGQWY